MASADTLRHRIIEVRDLRGDIIDMCSSDSHLYVIGVEIQHSENSRPYLAKFDKNYNLVGITRLPFTPFACTYSYSSRLIYVTGMSMRNSISGVMAFDEDLRLRSRIIFTTLMYIDDIVFSDDRIVIMATYHGVDNKIYLASIDSDLSRVLSSVTLSFNYARVIQPDVLVYDGLRQRIVGLAHNLRLPYNFHLIFDVNSDLKDYAFSIIKQIEYDPKSEPSEYLTLPLITLQFTKTPPELGLTVWSGQYIVVHTSGILFVHPQDGLKDSIKLDLTFPYKIGLDYNILYVFSENVSEYRDVPDEDFGKEPVGINVIAVSLYSRKVVARQFLKDITFERYYWSEYGVVPKKRAAVFGDDVVVAGYSLPQLKPVLAAVQRL